ncbi:MAG TPA: hypothetical protein PKA62_06100 [Thermoanaerobaculia bacterium]|nr:hypothetical protein [Thermoanaerobaculia bacterium]
MEGFLPGPSAEAGRGAGQRLPAGGPAPASSPRERGDVAGPRDRRRHGASSRRGGLHDVPPSPAHLRRSRFRRGRRPRRPRSAGRRRGQLHDGFTVGIVELDDQGRFWDRRQLRALEAEVLGQAGGPEDPGVVLTVFVHGWRHDARVCDANLACFRELLRRISLDQREALAARGGDARPRAVIGVFVGWRGLSSKAWPLEQLSFLGRKNAALRVGAGDTTELLTRLDRLRLVLNGAKRDASRLVVLGHSLGGTVVYEALSSIFKSRLAADWPGVDVNGASRVIRGFGDLVVLVNPAFEAERWRPIHELASSYADFSRRQRPVLVVVGSETDSATGTWFPLGQWAATVLSRTRDKEQRAALRTAIANYEPFVTHRLSRADLPPGGAGPRAPTPRVRGCLCDLPCDATPVDDGHHLLAAPAPPTSVPDGPDSGWIGQPCEPYRRLGPLALECKAPGRRGNPFLVVRAAPEVLHEHGGFFNPYFVSFLRRLLIDATAGTTTPEDLSPASR